MYNINVTALQLPLSMISPRHSEVGGDNRLAYPIAPISWESETNQTNDLVNSPTSERIWSVTPSSF